MPCFKPLNGFRSRFANPDTGKHSIVFSRRESFPPDHPRYEEISMPCGQCRFCRLEHSRQMALRCHHEASLYEKNCFLTLTYSDEHLPDRGFLDYEAPVLFMKRLRKRFGDGIRSFGCAEYGEETDRPHYHLCIFNFDFDDKILLRKYEKKGLDCSLFVSKTLQEIWPYGHSTVGNLTFESAAYVARYVTKKVTGKNAEAHYEVVCPESGEVFRRPPERSICVSRRPGIGRDWYEKNGKFIRDHDFVILRGKKVRPAKYYDRLFDVADPDSFEHIKQKRRAAGEKATAILEAENAENIRSHEWRDGSPTPKDRLQVMEECMELKFKQLSRGLENG